jgi:hypothetical protein
MAPARSPVPKTPDLQRFGNDQVARFQSLTSYAALACIGDCGGRHEYTGSFRSDARASVLAALQRGELDQQAVPGDTGTGQTQSWAVGDDGDQRDGWTVSPRFHDNDNGTVTDNLTGLVWLKNAHCFADVSWENAVELANAVADDQYDFCGLSDGSQPGDWRLPNIRQLLSLVDYSRTLCRLVTGTRSRTSAGFPTGRRPAQAAPRRRPGCWGASSPSRTARTTTTPCGRCAIQFAERPDIEHPEWRTDRCGKCRG